MSAVCLLIGFWIGMTITFILLLPACLRKENRHD